MEPARQPATTGGRDTHLRKEPPRAPSSMMSQQMQLPHPSHSAASFLPANFLPPRPTTGAPTLSTSPVVLDPRNGLPIPNPYAVDLSKRPQVQVFQPVTFSRTATRSRNRVQRAQQPAYQPAYQPYLTSVGYPSFGLPTQPPIQTPPFLVQRAKAAAEGYLRNMPAQFPTVGYIQAPTAAPQSTLPSAQMQMIAAAGDQYMAMPSASAGTAQKAALEQAQKQSRAVPIKNEQGEIVQVNQAGNNGKQVHQHQLQLSIKTDVLDDDESPIPQNMRLGQVRHKEEFSQAPGSGEMVRYERAGDHYLFDEHPEVRFTAKDAANKERQEREVAAAKEAMDRRLAEKALQNALAARRQTVMQIEEEVQKQARLMGKTDDQETAERFGVVPTSASQQLVQYGAAVEQEQKDEEEVVGGGADDGPGPAVVTEVQPTVADLMREVKELRELMVMLVEQMVRMEKRIDGCVQTHEWIMKHMVAKQ